jgi:hypothetical protein
MNSKFNYLNFQVQSRLSTDRPTTSHIAIPILTLSILLRFLSLGTKLFERGVYIIIQCFRISLVEGNLNTNFIWLTLRTHKICIFKTSKLTFSIHHAPNIWEKKEIHTKNWMVIWFSCKLEVLGFGRFSKCNNG